MIYEFKTYRAAPGAIGKLKQRFAEQTLPIFERHGIEVLHCWSNTGQPDVFHYLTRFQSEEARTNAWTAFGGDAEWKAIKTASEANGPLLAEQSAQVMTAEPFSPGK
ncbi:MAG: NIPSNAP family protein [Burkholderiales bacterium]